MNPHSHDYRDTVRAGEKTGSAFQSDRDFGRKTSPMRGVLIVMVVSPFIWGALIWAVMGLFRSW